MQQNDFSSPYYPHHHAPYHQNPNPNPYPNPNPSEFPPTNPIQPTYASAPPYSNYTPPEFPPYHPPYPLQNPDPVPNLPPPSPSFAQHHQPQPQPPQFPKFAPYNNPSFPPEPSTASYPSPINYYPAAAANYTPPSNPNLNPIPNPSNVQDLFERNYENPNRTPISSYENPYESAATRFDHGPGYFNTEDSRNYEQDLFERNYERNYEQDLYERNYDRSGSREDGLGEGVFRYDGGASEPYGARGTGPKSSSWSGLDDYGRSTSFSSSEKDRVGSLGKIAKAVPKVETQQDAKNGVQKFRVKLLPEGADKGPTDVLCQIGLDGIRMLEPNTNRTLRIYPLETVTRWEVPDQSTYTFWSKSSVDLEPRRIRLQSNRYTTDSILDTIAAATVQLKEMGGKESFAKSNGTSDTDKQSDQPPEKKKGIADWMNLIKPGNEEKDHWVPDEAVAKCVTCGAVFGAFVRRHHCRNCGEIFCDKCTQGRTALTIDDPQQVRVCDWCLGEVLQRLSHAKETANKSAALHTHEDLAKKLQEEMEKKFKLSSGSKPSDGSGKRMREVACPTCTVHLQVQVPTSGSETVECGVCQHPFLVSAH